MSSRRSVLLGLALSGAAAVCAQAAPAPSCSLAIEHANVAPMDAERILADRTVIIRGPRITAILPAKAAHPVCSRTVDAHGRYLVPGLNDMHVHVESAALAQAFGMKAAPVDFTAEMAPYMANGVTGVRVMSGEPDILAFRDSQRRAPLSPYPRLIVSTPMLSGPHPVLPEPATRVLLTPEAAREAVRLYRREGYDFVKVRDNLAPPVLRAVIDEARRNGLYVDGHLSARQGLSVYDVLAMGQKAVAHLDNLQLAISDPAKDPEKLARALRACGCFVETTLQVEAGAAAQLTDYDRLIARPELKYLNPFMVNAFWRKPRNPYFAGGASPAFFRKLLADEGALLMTLHRAGVHIVAGTDALNPMILPGSSLHDELASLVQAGFTPYEALRAATADPAAWVPGFSDVGVLAPGRTANAILVEGDPLHDIRALRAPEAVMINGQWMTRADLQARLDAAAALYAGH